MARADPSHPPSIIRLEGVLDGLAAGRVEAVLLRAQAGDRLLVDVTAVQEFHDFGVAVLGRALTRTRADVRLRGLRPEHLLVLRYFGMDPERIEGVVIPDGI